MDVGRTSFLQYVFVSSETKGMWTTILVAWKRYFLLIRYVVSVRVKQANYEYGESVFDSGEGA